MRRLCFKFAVGFAMLATMMLATMMLVTMGMAQQAPYKVLKTAKVGALGGFDYIYADDAGCRPSQKFKRIENSRILPPGSLVLDRSR